MPDEKKAAEEKDPPCRRCGSTEPWINDEPNDDDPYWVCPGCGWDGIGT